MKHFKLDDPGDEESSLNRQPAFLIGKGSDEFILIRRTVNWLMCLLTVSTIFALVLVALIATGKIGMTRFVIVIGVLFAGTVRYVPKLLANILSSICRTRD